MKINMKYLKTKNEIRGYKYSNGSSGKKWIRGRVMFSEGRQYVGQNEWRAVITKTNLDTGAIELASMKEAEKFLTPECYKEYVMDSFEQMARRN